MVTAKVAIIMGSKSDWVILEAAKKVLDDLGISSEVKIVSAHRTPERLYEFCKEVENSQVNVVIAGAGGAAHLPGMVASMTILPVLGVPVPSKTLAGMDSLLSIVQMPGGIPVGTLAIGEPGAKNAALLAASILALEDPKLRKRLQAFRKAQTESVPESPL